MFEDTNDEALESDLCSQASTVAVEECQLALLVAEFDRRGIWAVQGARTCAHWLNWRIGMSLGAAREQVRVGRALAHRPATLDAFQKAQISYSKVRAITRIDDPSIESSLLEMAQYATASQLERIVREYRRATDFEKQAAARHQLRYLRTYTDDDGMLVIKARLSPEDGAVVLAAIQAAQSAVESDDAADRSHDSSTQSSISEPVREPVETLNNGHPDVQIEGGHVDSYSERGQADLELENDAAFGHVVSRQEEESSGASHGHRVSAETSPTALWDSAHGDGPLYESERSAADALVAVCSSALDAGFDDGSAGDHVKVLVHVDEQVLKDPEASGCCHVDGVGTIAPHVARRLACDSAVSQLIYRSDGNVVPHGNSRSPSRRLRQAILTRDDGQCRFPSCNRRRGLHVHHVVFWSNGGKTTVSNLVTLCDSHHRLVHEGGWNLELKPTGILRVVDSQGNEVENSPAMAPPSTRTDSERVGEMPYRGERFDLGLTLDALLCRSGKLWPSQLQNV